MATGKDHPRFSREEYERRFREIRRRMKDRKIDALILYGDSGCGNANHCNVKYVSNYQDPISSYVVFPLRGEPSVHMSNRLYLPYARLMSIFPRTGAERRARQLVDPDERKPFSGTDRLPEKAL